MKMHQESIKSINASKGTFFLKKSQYQDIWKKDFKILTN